MKKTDNNEMDLFLRALAKRNPIAAAESDRKLTAHLDADELNCFAEGITTAAERSRYVKHLADCSTCRDQVTRLVPVSAVLRREVSEQETAPRFRTWIGSLLSPAVLRYALPALVLTGVLAIALLALRQQRQADFVAQNNPATETPHESNATANVPSSVNSQAPIANQQTTPSAIVSSRETEAAKVNVNKETSAPVAGVVASADKDLRMNKPAPAPPAEPKNEAPSEAAAPPPPLSSRTDLDVLQKAAEARKQDDQNYVDRRGREEANAQVRDANEADRVSSSRKGPSRAGSSVAGLSSVATRKVDETSRTETRNISGRAFQHQGGAWIDTAYEAGRATVNVKRGSEQFRALMSDEPGLRAIAEQLSGEVVVVWKGIAYRIH
ncbi:MAG TPA: hypothetical protein VJT50_11370 [Pyrinomonadaceae bacterium]|nr:hypothetical protein [Pyrinomonadaceae bacterium]